MNTVIPFICLGIGAAISWRGLPRPVIRAVDILIDIALVILMLVIGLNIGISPQVMDNMGSIVFECGIISLAAIFVSALLVILCEKTILPLEETRKKFISDAKAMDGGEGHFSPLIIIMPAGIVIGVIFGHFIFPNFPVPILDVVLTLSLILLYVGVGVSLGENKRVFLYIKQLGARLLVLPAVIFIGSILGGAIVGALMDIPMGYAVISASGMGYYSLTGAAMTDFYGIEAGTYGFIVNVFRDVFTILLMPVLVRMSKGSPIASGAAGCMDTMLVPVTKAVGVELGIVALISGTILTFVVPVWLPLSHMIFP